MAFHRSNNPPRHAFPTPPSPSMVHRPPPDSAFPSFAAPRMNTSPARGTGQYTEELWHACAGPLVSVPKVGEHVWYFPQGHMEQVAASTHAITDQQMPKYYQLSSQILCRVMQLSLSAESDTDEVFAQLSLLPEPNNNCDFTTDKEEPPPQPRRSVRLFTKILTASDTSTHGGFSVLRKHAEECLPPLDMSQETPSQELIATDLHGQEWKFRHTYRGHPRRHLLTTGWSYFVSQKRLVAGDAVIFLRGDNDELRVGIRRSKRQQSSQSSNVLTGHSMHMAVVATASYAVQTRTMFAVYYTPRVSPSPFLVPAEKLANCLSKNLSVGMRFKMKYEAEDASDRSFAGTITGIEDVDATCWPNSKWRSLRVNWDEMTMLERQDRVSPWEIDLCVSSPPVNPSPGSKNKRARPASVSGGTTLGNPSKAAFVEQMKIPGVLQGQGIGGLANEELLKSHLWGTSYEECRPASVTDASLGNPSKAAFVEQLKNPGVLQGQGIGGLANEELLRSRMWGNNYEESSAVEVQGRLKNKASVEAWMTQQEGRRQDIYSGVLSAVAAQGGGGVGGNTLELPLDGHHPHHHQHHHQLHTFQQQMHGLPQKQAAGFYSPFSSLELGADLQLSVAATQMSCLAGNGSQVIQSSQWQTSPHSFNSVISPQWHPCSTFTSTSSSSNLPQHTIGYSQYCAQDKGPDKPVIESSCKLFGFSLTEALPSPPCALKSVKGGNVSEEEAVCVKASSQQQSPGTDPSEMSHPVPPSDVKSHASSELEKSDNSVQKSSREVDSRTQAMNLPSRSCTKVIKKGSMVGRGVDLSKFDCYGKLIEELEGMFHIEGELSNPEKGWQVAYSDNEGDMMHVGDDPWTEFCDMVRKIYIFSPEEVQSAGLPSSPSRAHIPTNCKKDDPAGSHKETTKCSELRDSSVPALPG